MNKFLKKEDVPPSFWTVVKWSVFDDFKKGLANKAINENYWLHPEEIEKLRLEHERIQELDANFEKKEKEEKEHIEKWEMHMKKLRDCVENKSKR